MGVVGPVIVTQIAFALSGPHAVLGLVPVWFWMGATALLLRLAAADAAVIYRRPAPRRRHPAWIPLAILLINTAVPAIWVPLLRATV